MVGILLWFQIIYECLQYAPLVCAKAMCCDVILYAPRNVIQQYDVIIMYHILYILKYMCAISTYSTRIDTPL